MDLGFSKNLSLGLPKQPSPAQNFLIESVLLVIVCGLFYWFLIMPKQAEISTKQDAYDQLVLKEQKIKGDKDALIKMSREFAKHADDIEKLDKALPLEANLPELETMLTQMANRVGVDLATLNVSGFSTKYASGDKQLLADKFKPARTLQKATGNLYVKGNFTQLFSFLQALEQSGRLININEIEINNGSGGQLNLRVNIITYIFGT